MEGGTSSHAGLDRTALLCNPEQGVQGTWSRERSSKLPEVTQQERGDPRIQSQSYSQPPDHQPPEVDFETEEALKSRLLSQGPLSRGWRKTPSFLPDPKNASPLLWPAVA